MSSSSRVRSRLAVAALAGAGVAASLIAVSAGELPATIDLDSTSPDVLIEGALPGGLLGHAIASADVSGDGIDDLIIGAPYADSAGGDDAGEVYVVFGGPALPGVLDLSTAGADVIISGPAPAALLGHAVASGDVNDDGIADVIIGAHGADPGDRLSAGETYVFFGGSGLGGAIDLTADSADIVLLGASSGDGSGFAVASGDVDADGIDDLVIGANNVDAPAGQDAGAAYVVYAGGGLPATIDLRDTPPDVSILGGDAFFHTGESVAVGDLNGDGAEDVIVGASQADTAAGNDAGRAYVVLGGDSLPATVDLRTAAAGMTVLGSDAGGRLGFSVATGDLNGDGVADFIVGAYLANGAGELAGRTYVVYGGGSLPAVLDLLSMTADLTVSGDDAGDHAGVAVATGDVSGDGTDDLIVGAEYGDPPGGIGAGETYVIHGGPSLPALIDLDVTAADLTVLGDDMFDFSGRVVASGDVNADGIDDVIIGAISAAPGDRYSAGEVYVIYGRSTAAPTPTPEPGLRGDADDDGAVTSIDATLILQVGAGLLDVLPGGELADVNGDGDVSAIDAALVLQFVAGLVSSL